MSLIGQLSGILEESREEYEQAAAGDFNAVTQSPSATGKNLLARGDNLAFMKYLVEEKKLSGKLQLIYIDPPFFSKANYDAVVKIEPSRGKEQPAIKLRAYHDLWENGMADYLRMLCARFFAIKDLLSEEGCFLVHLDWHVVHYVKIMLDEIFGEKNFVNEIIWQYKSGGTSKRHFSRKHDTLLFYAKSGKYHFMPQTEKSYNREFKPYRFKGVKEYRDEMGWYTMVNMKDVWQLDMVGRTSSERTGYATQKPEALLARIIESCSRPGDLCADFFSGSGTLAAAAEKAGRRWICCDVGVLAFAGAEKRLAGMKADYQAVVSLEAGAEKPFCRAEVSAELHPMELSDKVVLSLALLSYDMDVRRLPVDEADAKLVEKIRKKDSLSLIDYWSVDFHWDGRVHRPELVLPMAGAKERTPSHQRIGEQFGRISVRVVDIFGNETYREFDLQENGSGE